MKKVLILGVLVFICILSMIACQSSLFFYPQKKLVANPEFLGIPFESVFFNTKDNQKLHGWWIPGAKDQNTVLFFHGNAGNISHRLNKVKLYHKHKMNLFIFDYRGYGKSSGNPDEEGTYRDAEAAWQYLIKDLKIKSNHIIIHGRSLGGSIAAWLAHKVNPKILIVESSFTSIKNVAKDHVSFQPMTSFITYKYSTSDYLKKVKCPVLIIHGTDDEVIPYSHGKELFKSIKGQKEFLTIEGTHNYIYSKKHYEDKLIDFISNLSD